MLRKDVWSWDEDDGVGEEKGDPYKTRGKRGCGKDSVNHNDIGIRRCGLCQFFGNPRPDRWGFCSKRNDIVHPAGLCELYIALSCGEEDKEDKEAVR
jgi:hypothetical protein